MASYSFFGIIFLALPGSILGTGLALKIQEEQKTDIYRIPAAKLIQSVWRTYSTNQNSSDSPLWTLVYRRTDGQPLTHTDRSCIRFIRLVLYLKQRHRFKIKFGSIKDDFFREKSTREMSRRLESIGKEVKIVTKISAEKTNKNLQSSQELIKKLRDKLNDIKAKK